MKLRFRILSMFAVAGLLLAACQTLDVEQPVTPEDSLVGRDLVVHASWGDESSTKTAIQENGISVWWTTGETLNLFKGAAYTGQFLSTNTEPAASADFIGQVTAVEGAAANPGDLYWAVYPYDEGNTCDGESVTLTVPAVQTASEGTFADKLFPAVAVSSTLDMHFYNVCGGACFTVVTEGIRSVTFKSRGGEALAGKVKVIMDGDERPSVQSVLVAESEVTVFAPNGGTFIPGKSYYAALLPQTLSGGIDIEYRTAFKMATCSLNRSLNIIRSSFGLVTGKDSGLTFVDMPIDRRCFPDVNFADYVFSNFDWDGNGVLSQEERENVTYINVNTDNISSVQGIEYFPYLNQLYCRANYNWINGTYVGRGKLTSIDVSNNPELLYLDCRGNQLTALDVSANTKLVDLQCYINKLTSITLNPALQWLSCYNNQLTELDLSGLTALQTIYCSNNRITALDVSRFAGLQNLQCYGNLLESLDVSHNPALYELYCSNNRLTSLDVTHNPQLMYLSFSNNAIPTIDLTNNPLLVNLECASTGLTSLDLTLFPNLQYLSCGNNPLQSLNLSTNTELQTLYCSNLSLSSLDVSPLTKLENLECGNNQLTSLNLRNNSKLRTLYCWGNKLTEIDVTECPMLASINCEDNQLVSLDVSGNPVLSYLYAMSNPLTTLYIVAGQTIQNEYLPEGVTKVVKEVEGMTIDETSFPDAAFRTYVSENFDKNGDGKLSKAEKLAVTRISLSTKQMGIVSMAGIQYFTNLTELYCYGDGSGENLGPLASLDLSQNTNLTYVNCRYNVLASLILPAGSTLQSVYCQYNQLTSLDVSLCTGLQSLQCGYNQLTALDLRTNTALTYIYARNNQQMTSVLLPEGLTQISYEAFRNCTALTEIDIPASVTYIGGYAFYYCTALQRVNMHSTTPPYIDYAVFGSTNNCPIYVPVTAVDTYKAADNWSNYASRIVSYPGAGTNEGIGFDEW